MSWNPSLEPGCPDATAVDAIETVIVPRARDLGGFEVRRALPAPKRQMVGPFVFFDQAGPAEFITGKGVDVRPHPHIGLGTVTYLYRGEFQHRDSIGSNQIILPGAVNWMVAGRGVTHSERTSAETRQAPHALFGIQTWIALPEDKEEVAPSFEHHGKETLPGHRGRGRVRSADPRPRLRRDRPRPAFQRHLLPRRDARADGALPAPRRPRGPGLYIVEGSVSIAGQTFEAGRMMVFRPGDAITVAAARRAPASSRSAAPR